MLNRGIPPITKNLLIINAILFALVSFDNPLKEWLYMNFSAFYPESPLFKGWQVLTHMFMHGGFSHFFFNMFALYMFGSAMEHQLGEKRFILLYFLSGLGAFFLFNLVNYLKVHGIISASPEQIALIPQVPMVGASGAIYGLLTAFGIWYPNEKLMLIFPPIPVKAKIFIPILLAIEFYLGLADFAWNPIAHFAHLGGALIGFILVRNWKKNQFRRN